MKLISEEIQNAEYLVEEANGKKNYKIRGVFLQSDIKNRNGRIYENDTKTRKKSHYVRDATNGKCYIVRWYGKSWESTEAEEKGGVLIEAENGIDEYVQRLNQVYSSSFVDLCGVNI